MTCAEDEERLQLSGGVRSKECAQVRALGACDCDRRCSVRGEFILRRSGGVVWASSSEQLLAGGRTATKCFSGRHLPRQKARWWVQLHDSERPSRREKRLETLRATHGRMKIWKSRTERIICVPSVSLARTRKNTIRGAPYSACHDGPSLARAVHHPDARLGKVQNSNEWTGKTQSHNEQWRQHHDRARHDDANEPRSSQEVLVVSPRNGGELIH